MIRYWKFFNSGNIEINKINPKVDTVKIREMGDCTKELLLMGKEAEK